MATTFVPSNLEIVLSNLTYTFIKVYVEGDGTFYSVNQTGSMLPLPPCEFNCPRR